MSTMRVTAWSNGTGLAGGYGIRVSMKDRDVYFDFAWDWVVVQLEDGKEAKCSLSCSLWSDKRGTGKKPCIELRKAEIGRWMLEEGLAPWPAGRPPVLILEPVTERHFRLRRPP